MDERRAITIRAANEDEAREYLTPAEATKVERVTITGELEVADEDRQLLAQLGRRPEWGALRRIGEYRMRKHFERLARGFAHAGHQPDYAQLQWQRGVFAGIKFLLDHPTMEARKLERLLAEERMIDSA